MTPHTINCGAKVNILSLKKISTKPGVDLDSRAKIQTFTTEWSGQWVEQYP